MAISVQISPTAQRSIPGTVFGVPTPVILFDGSQSGFAAQKIISNGDSQANTKLAMTKLDIDSSDNLRELVAVMQVGGGSAGLRLVINPGSDDLAALYLSQGYPNVYFIPSGQLVPVQTTFAMTNVYFVPVLLNGSTLASTKGNVSVLTRSLASVKGFSDAPNTHLYRLTGSGSQTRSNRAGFQTQFITHTAASWDTNTGELAGNGAAYGTLPADVSSVFSGFGVGDKLIISTWSRATTVTSGKYYFGIGRTGGGTGNKSGCFTLQQTGTGPIGLNYRKGSANDNDHTTTDVTLSSQTANSSTAKCFSWIFDVGAITDEISVFTNGVFENSAVVSKPTGGLVYPYYDATAGGAVVGARISSSAVSDFLVVGEFMSNFFIAKYSGITMDTARGIVMSLYTSPGAFDSRMS